MFKMHFRIPYSHFQFSCEQMQSSGSLNLRMGKKFLNDTSLKENFKAEFKCSYFLLFYVFLLFL